eukprot:1842960-Rhodomonas_salina.1
MCGPGIRDVVPHVTATSTHVTHVGINCITRLVYSTEMWYHVAATSTHVTQATSPSPTSRARSLGQPPYLLRTPYPMSGTRLPYAVLRERVSPTRFEPISYDTFGAELVYLLSSVWYWVGVSPTQRAVRKWRISYHCIVLSSRMVQCKRRNRHQVPGQIPLGAADPGRTRPWLGFVSVFFCRAAVQVSSLQLRAGRGARVCFTRKAV